MSDVLNLSPVKVQLIRADLEDADITDVIESPSVTVDPRGRKVSIRGGERSEEGSIQGELAASARGVKITCGGEGEETRSIHLTFSEPSELDSAVEQLEGAGLTVVRSTADPEVRQEQG